MRVSLLALRYNPRWRSRILSGVLSLTAITPPSLFKRLDESRVSSLLRHYPDSSVLRTPPTPRPPGTDFGHPYTEPSRPSPATNEIPRVTQCSFPHMPPRRPRRAHLLLYRLSSQMGGGLPHLTTGSALSINKSRGSMGFLIVRPVGLQSFPKKVFSIHLVLRVAPQNRIFGSGVYR